MTPRLLSLASLLAWGLTLPVAAQEEPEVPPGAFTEVIEVRVVNVEVVVTDAQGVRVSGLTPKDFRLKVDGEEVPIEYFTEIRGGTALVQAAPEAVEAPPGLPALAPGSPVGTSYLLFIDDFFSISRDRNQVLQRMAEDLAFLTPEDRMAVVAYDGRELQMLTTWTGSQRKLEQALRQAMERPAYGLQRLAERRRLETDRRLGDFNVLGRASFFELTPIERDYAQRLEDQIQRAVTAATMTLRSFAAPPGRKVMVLLAGGWPFDPVRYTLLDPHQPVTETGIRMGADLFRPLVDTANLLGYTLYPVDVPGLASALVDAAQDTFPTVPASALNFLEFEVHSSLRLLAEETGGRALLDASRMESLAQVAQDTRSYYWLGFTPSRQRDDRRHRIEVEVLRPGLKVRTREGFSDLSRETEVSMMVESALLFGGPPSELPLRVKVDRPRRTTRRTVEIPLTIQIPLDEVTMLPRAQGYEARLELRMAALDEKGNRSEIPVVPVHLTGEKKPAEGSYATYEIAVRLSRQRQRLMIVVYDTLSGKLLSTSVEVAP